MPTEPRTDYNAVAEEACSMAGGQCVTRGECSPDTDAFLTPICRPGVGGLACCRKGAAPECKTLDSACCQLVQGKPSSSGTTCDRGYPSCAGVTGEHWLSGDTNCESRLEEPAAEAQSKWPGALSAAEAGRWACTQVGGATITDRSAACDGYEIAIDGANRCCVPKALCPETTAGTECCVRDGTLMAKLCVNGHAECAPQLIGLRTLREIPAGTCAPFTP
jgi:hypothetical protein